MRRWLRILAVMAVTVAVTMKYGAQLYFRGRTVQRGGRHAAGHMQNDRERHTGWHDFARLFDETGTIVASMTEDAYRSALAYPGGRMCTFPKNAKGEVEMARARQTETYARAPLQAPDTAQP